MKRILATLAVVLALVIVGHPSDPLLSAQSADGHTAMYSVKVTNLTTAQFFAPLLVVTHAPSMNLFLPGTQASEELRAMAEVGNVEPLMMMLDGMMGVMDVQAHMMMTTPGVTTPEIMVMGAPGYRVSLVAMLVPTNDAFLGANLMLPMYGVDDELRQRVRCRHRDERRDVLLASEPPARGLGGVRRHARCWRASGWR